MSEPIADTRYGTPTQDSQHEKKPAPSGVLGATRGEAHPKKDKTAYDQYHL